MKITIHDRDSRHIIAHTPKKYQTILHKNTGGKDNRLRLPSLQRFSYHCPINTTIHVAAIYLNIPNIPFFLGFADFLISGCSSYLLL